MKRFFFVLMLTLTLGMAGCSGGNPKETFETAALEERQGSFDHARQLYQEIIEKYPDSEFAAKARERLKSLDKKE